MCTLVPMPEEIIRSLRSGVTDSCEYNVSARNLAPVFLTSELSLQPLLVKYYVFFNTGDINSFYEMVSNFQERLS